MRIVLTTMVVALTACGTGEEPLDLTPTTPITPVSMRCAPGWVDEDRGGTLTCLPWSVRAQCDASSAQFPGEASCVRLGSACSGDRFPDVEGDVRYVLAGRPTGDGSSDRPFGSIAVALEGAAPGTVIAIGAGDYVGPIVVPAGVSLFGVCPEGTRIVASADEVAVTITGRNGLLRDLSIHGARTGVELVPGATARVEGVTVSEISDRGIDVGVGAALSASDVALRDFTGDSRENEPRQAAIYVNDGTVRLSRVAIERIVGTGFRIAGPEADVTIEDSTISETTHGCGVRVAEGSARLDRVVIEHVHIAGVTVSTRPGLVELHDVMISDVSAGWEYDWGFGVDARIAGTAVLERVTVERIGGIGLMSFLDGSIGGEDIVVRETVPRACGVDECLGMDFGVGAGIYQSEMSLRNFLIADAVLCGVQMAREASVDLVNGEIRNNLIGANVQQPDYDIDRLSAGVRYVGNGQNLDAADLPIPTRQLPP